MSAPDPYLRPAFPLTDRIRRQLWGIVWQLFFRTSPRPLHAWRRMLLRLFGASIGSNCHIYPGARIWAPWNLTCGEVVAVADGAVLYNPSPIYLGSHSTISQEAYLCGATHDYEDPDFSLTSSEIYIGEEAWICARATVQSGLRVGPGAVLALGSVATRDLEPWTVYAGVPARKIKQRTRRES
jgi:putative colanic acid biosynthesis acetyltransferase WcaF